MTEYLGYIITIGLSVSGGLIAWLSSWNNNLNGRLKTIENQLLTNNKDDESFKDKIMAMEPRLKNAEEMNVRNDEKHRSMEKQLEKYADSQKETNDRVWNELSKVSHEVKMVQESICRIDTNQEIQIDQMKELAVQVSKLVVSMEKGK